MAEAPWRRRFRALRVTLPLWARDAPNRLIYLSNSAGKWEIYAWDRARDAHRQVTDRPEGTIQGTIDPTGGRIWWFDDAAGNEFGRWMVQPFDEGPAIQAGSGLPPAYSAGLSLGRSTAVIGASTEEGSSIRLLRMGEEPVLLYVHPRWARAASLSRDERLIAINHSEQGDSRHPAVRVLDVKGRTIGDLWDGPGRALWVEGWSPVRGDSRLLIHHERRGTSAPLLWDTASGEVVDPVLELPGEVSASWYPDGRALLLLHEHRGRTEMYRMPPDGGGLEPISTERGTITQARAHPDGQVWYAISTAASAPEIRADGRVILTPPGEPAPRGVPYADHTIEGIHVFVAEPPGPRPHPTIFMIHGGPEAHDREVYSALVQAWVDHGLAAVMINYRGSSGYGRAWRDAITGNPGFTEMEDIGRVREWAVRSGLTDPSRLILSGRSWGGYLTLLGLGMHPEQWSLGIAGVPVADTIAAFEDEMEPLKAYDISLFGGSPQEIPEKYRERSPITYVERVRVPLLILAGENDPRCPIRQIDLYIAQLRALGKPHEVYRYEAGHGSLVIEETIKQTEIQIAFASRHLGTGPPQ